MSILSIDPTKVSTPEMHGYLLGAVAPRPIAFASTVDNEGRVNLSPFSFFNCFSANPPILIFSPARRVRDNTTKHTLENVRETGEVVINIVNHDIIGQMSLASTEYGKGVNEFEKSGLTEITSQKVKPPRVAESPASFECKVNDIIALGEEGGAGNLVICEVVMAHFKESILDEERRIDPYKLDAVARMGGNWYCRAQGEAIFEWPKPLARKGMGMDQLPETIRNSQILNGNDLSTLANVETIPDAEKAENFITTEGLGHISKEEAHRVASDFLKQGEVEKAWWVLKGQG